MLSTGRSMYTVALRQLVEQRADWTWAAIQIVEKKPASDPPRGARRVQSCGRNLSVSVRWNSSGRSGRGSGDDLRIARCTASS